MLIIFNIHMSLENNIFFFFLFFAVGIYGGPAHGTRTRQWVRVCARLGRSAPVTWRQCVRAQHVRLHFVCLPVLCAQHRCRSNGGETIKCRYLSHARWISAEHIVRCVNDEWNTNYMPHRFYCVSHSNSNSNSNSKKKWKGNEFTKKKERIQKAAAEKKKKNKTLNLVKMFARNMCESKCGRH